MAHILLVDDDPAMLSFLSTALERAGHTITARHDGLEALNTLKEMTSPPDLLLTDVVMPGMDGIELSRTAAELFPALKVMFITGFSAVSLGPKNSAKISSRVLSKPFHLNDLIARVNEILAE